MAEIELEYIRSQIVSRLPIRVRWLVKGIPLDFDFSRSQSLLEPVNASDFGSLGLSGVAARYGGKIAR